VANGYLDRLPTYKTMQPCQAATKGVPIYTYEQLKVLAGQVPIYYRSWNQLHESFRMAAEQFGDERNHTHWEKIVQEIGEISQIAGKYA